MKDEFKRQLINTGYIHSPLKADDDKSTEARLLRKSVLDSRPLWDGKSRDVWITSGTGGIALFAGGCLKMTAPARADHWPENESQDGDYAGFGVFKAALRLPDEDWRSYNRLVCRIRPECMGFHHPLIKVELVNDGVEKIPDVYMREGFHDINLKNHEWNNCVWEFPDLPRDKVTELAFSVVCDGKEPGGDDCFTFEIGELRLERVENPDSSLGWQVNPGSIAFSTTGYWLGGKKTAVANCTEGSFELLREEDGAVVYSAPVRPVRNEKGCFGLLDFSGYSRPGRYRLRLDGITTESFEIGGQIMEEAVWKVINFLYCERCGYPLPGGHPTCHGDIMASHNGLQMSYCGGWHDAGDLSQQTLQTAEITHGLFEVMQRVKADVPLYVRLMEEACWGLDFVLRTRFGDGFRATSAGIRRWTNGLTGDMDDEEARVHNRSFENFMMAGVEAYAGSALREEDADLSWKCINAAKEDYRFALERFEKVGMENCIMFEHTYNASLSQYYAVAAWSASETYAACREEFFAMEAARFADLMLACQETGSPELPLKGFFYRDAGKRVIVHFNHQAREHLFIQALESLCRNQPGHEKRPAWENSMRLYGEYLKHLFVYAQPYGMLPAGLHSLDEAEDRETFPLLHLMTDYESDRDNYEEQVKAGVKVTEKHYIRQFPVWFSFRGNTAVLLSSGKAASLIGRYFNDEELLQIAREQLYWIAGKNPFAQSLIYGEGSNYAQQNAALAGEMAGEIPVGIQTRGNEDRPYWPMANNATYKEVWTTSAGHWLWVAADLYRN